MPNDQVIRPCQKVLGSLGRGVCERRGEGGGGNHLKQTKSVKEREEGWFIVGCWLLFGYCWLVVVGYCWLLLGVLYQNLTSRIVTIKTIKSEVIFLKAEEEEGRIRKEKKEERKPPQRTDLVQ